MFYDASFLVFLIFASNIRHKEIRPRILRRGHLPTVASAKDNGKKNVKESGRTMCLHAKELSLCCPLTEVVSLSFSPAPSFC